MICKSSYWRDTTNYKDTTLAVISVDERLLKVMKAAVILEIKETAGYLASDMDADDYMDAVNYIKDLTSSLEELDKSLQNIIDIPEAEEVRMKMSESEMRFLRGRKRTCKRGSVSEADRQSVCNMRKAFNLPCGNCKYNDYCYKEVTHEHSK